MKDLADASAKAAAHEVASQFREEMQRNNEKLQEDLVKAFDERLHAYHGEMKPEDHITQHYRMNRLLDFFDKTSSNIFGQVIKGLISWIIMIFLIGYFFWTNGHSSVTDAASKVVR